MAKLQDATINVRAKVDFTAAEWCGLVFCTGVALLLIVMGAALLEETRGRSAACSTCLQRNAPAACKGPGVCE